MKKARRKQGGKSAVRSFLFALAGVWLLTSAALMLWPFAPLGVMGTVAQAQEIDRLFHVAQTQLEGGGAVNPFHLQEAGLNAWFQASVREDQFLRLQAGLSQVTLIAGEPLSGFTVTTRYVWTRDDPHVPMQLQSLWLGHLPVPRFLSGLLGRGLVRRFRLEVPEEAWGSLTILNAERQRITLGPKIESAP